jgi:hypothetical protein
VDCSFYYLFLLSSSFLFGHFDVDEVINTSLFYLFLLLAEVLQSPMVCCNEHLCIYTWRSVGVGGRFTCSIISCNCSLMD